MDLQGKVLYTIRKKVKYEQIRTYGTFSIREFKYFTVVSCFDLQKLQAFERWDGYRSSGSPSKTNKEKEKACFQVKRYIRMLMGSIACQITVECDKYWIVRLAGKGGVRFRIVDIDGDIVAEVSLMTSLID